MDGVSRSLGNQMKLRFLEAYEKDVRTSAPPSRMYRHVWGSHGMLPSEHAHKMWRPSWRQNDNHELVGLRTVKPLTVF